MRKFNPDFSVVLETVRSKAYLYPVTETNYAILPTHQLQSNLVVLLIRLEASLHIS